jgi:hypothetical protein
MPPPPLHPSPPTAHPLPVHIFSPFFLARVRLVVAATSRPATVACTSASIHIVTAPPGAYLLFPLIYSALRTDWNRSLFHSSYCNEQECHVPSFPHCLYLCLQPAGYSGRCVGTSSCVGLPLRPPSALLIRIFFQ